MGLTERIKGAYQVLKGQGPININKKLPPAYNLVQRIIQQQNYRVRQDLQKWRQALMSAENIISPSRYLLYTVYREVILDPHLSALIESRKNKVLGKKFALLNEAGEELEGTNKTLSGAWFYNFLSLALDARYWGFSLVQFQDLVNDTFIGVELVPRENVKPELGIVVTHYAHTEGIPYQEGPVANWVLGIGEPKDLGLLNKACPMVIQKRNALGAWSEFIEIFGHPFRVGKTDTQDLEKKTRLEQAMADMSTATWMVTDLDDVIEFIDGKTVSSADIYSLYVEKLNSELSKLILGQTGTTDEKAYSGSANVHQDVSQEYMEADIRHIETIVNTQLLPMMARLGMPVNGLTFKYDRTEILGKAEQIKIDAELLKYYDLPADYILKTYNTPVLPKASNQEEDPNSPGGGGALKK